MAKQNFKGTEGEFITEQQARKMTSVYRNSKYHGELGGINAYFFGKDKIDQILKQKDVKGIRVYYGIEYDETGKPVPQIVLIGTNADGRDITEGLILDNGWPCPPFCNTDGLWK